MLALAPTDVGNWKPFQLWMFGHSRLGYGDWDEDTHGPFQKWAGLESYKLAKVMTKRRVSNEKFVVAVLWCQRHHKRIENAVWVLNHVDEAWAEHMGTERTDIAVLIERAIAEEYARDRASSPQWVARLSRARGPYRQEVLDEWRRS